MSYEHPNDNNLKNLHKAMDYNASGEPVLRTHVDGISLQGDVIVDTVSLSPSTLAALETINIGSMPEVEIKNDATPQKVLNQLFQLNGFMETALV